MAIARLAAVLEEKEDGEGSRMDSGAFLC